MQEKKVHISDSILDIAKNIRTVDFCKVSDILGRILTTAAQKVLVLKSQNWNASPDSFSNMNPKPSLNPHPNLHTAFLAHLVPKM